VQVNVLKIFNMYIDILISAVKQSINNHLIDKMSLSCQLVLN